MRNVAAVAATQKDGEHRYYLPKKYLKKNEGYLVKESKCGCMDIYKINRLEQKNGLKNTKKVLIVLIQKDFHKKHIVQEEKRNKGVDMDTYNKSVQHQ